MAAKKKQEAPEVIVAYKGFDKDFKCRDFQYEVGKTYEHKGDVEVCASGFHACEYPLDVLTYYAPAESRFAIVEQGGKIARHGEDSKLASSSITIKAELDLPGVIKAAIEYTMARVTPAKDATNAKEKDAASNSGDRGAASNSGYRGAASNSGNSGAASNSGNYGAASNSGDSGAASNSGAHGIAADFNGWGKARSCAGGAIVCTKRSPHDASIIAIRASKVGENGVKPDTWYTLDGAGEFVEI